MRTVKRGINLYCIQQRCISIEMRARARKTFRKFFPQIPARASDENGHESRRVRIEILLRSRRAWLLGGDDASAFILLPMLSPQLDVRSMLAGRNVSLIEDGCRGRFFVVVSPT